MSIIRTLVLTVFCAFFFAYEGMAAQKITVYIGNNTFYDDDAYPGKSCTSSNSAVATGGWDNMYLLVVGKKLGTATLTCSSTEGGPASPTMKIEVTVICSANTSACGSSCCASTEKCDNGSCIACGSGESGCGATCCPAGQICYEGQCSCNIGGKWVAPCGTTCCAAGETCNSNNSNL